MEEVDYKRVREIMWTDKPFRLRELPAYFGFPLLIKVVKGSDDMEHKEKFAKGEILRIDGEERQRRVIATDSKGRHWSFPVHIGCKFDVKSKKETRKSMYMSEIVDAEKLPKKFCFAKKDDMQIKIKGEDPSSFGPLVEGDFKTKEMTRVRIFKANRISDGDIKLKVVFLPAYMDVDVVIATKLACEPDAYWDDYMDAMTSDISKKVNLNMYRGKSDIQIYEFPEKAKKSTKQKSACLYEEQAPTKIVSVGSILKQRPNSTKRMSRTPSTSSGGQNHNMRTFSTPEGAKPEEPKRAVADILTDLQDKNEAELTEEEIRVAKHRRMLLAMFAREEEEEEEKRRSQIMPDGAACDDDEVDGDVDKDIEENNDDNDDDDDDDKDIEDDGDDESDSTDTRGEGDGDVIDDIQRPRSPGDGSTVSAESENNESVFVDDSPAEPVRPKPRIPTRRTPGLHSPQSPTAPSNPDPQSSVQQVVQPTTKQSPPCPPLKPKPAVPRHKPTISPNKPAVPSRKPDLNPSIHPHISAKLSRAQVVNSSDHSRFTTIQDFPSDLRGLTIDDMCKAMQFLRLDKYEGQIRENKIDGEMASELSEDMIISDLGLSGLEAKKLYKFIHDNWRPL